LDEAKSILPRLSKDQLNLGQRVFPEDLPLRGTQPEDGFASRKNEISAVLAYADWTWTHFLRFDHCYQTLLTLNWALLAVLVMTMTLEKRITVYPLAWPPVPLQYQELQASS